LSILSELLPAFPKPRLDAKRKYIPKTHEMGKNRRALRKRCCVCAENMERYFIFLSNLFFFHNENFARKIIFFKLYFSKIIGNIILNIGSFKYNIIVI
jgi:uncharacterized membrane protein (GlpM family)